MSVQDHLDIPQVGRNESISTEMTQSQLINELKQNQTEQMQLMADKVESSFEKLSQILTTVITASGDRKRGSEHSVSSEAGPSSSKTLKVARLSQKHGNPSEDIFDEEPSEDEQPSEADRVSIPEAGSLDNDIAELLNSDSDEKKAEGDLDESFDEVLAQIEAELSLSDKKGENINPKLAKITNSLFSNKMSDEKTKEKLNRQLIPENCTGIDVAKCNPEIWGTLPKSKKLWDISVQKDLNLINKAAAAVTTISNNLLNAKASGGANLPINSMLTSATDAIALLGQASQELHQIRRDNIKPHLPSALKGLTYNTPAGSSLLFGDDLPKRIQTMRATNTALSSSTFTGYKSHSREPGQSSVAWSKAPKNRYTPQRGSAFGKRGARRRQGTLPQQRQQR